MIRTQFGFHILQVEEKQAAHVKTVDEVHDLIMANLMQQAQADGGAEYAAKLQAQAQQSRLAEDGGPEPSAGSHRRNGLQQGGVVPGLADGTRC